MQFDSLSLRPLVQNLSQRSIPVTKHLDAGNFEQLNVNVAGQLQVNDVDAFTEFLKRYPEEFSLATVLNTDDDDVTATTNLVQHIVFAVASFDGLFSVNLHPDDGFKLVDQHLVV